MDGEVIKLLFCVATFGGIVYLAIREKIHKTNPAGFKIILFIFIGVLLAFLFFIIPGCAKYAFTMIGVTMGGVIIKISYNNIHAVSRCSIEIKGIYQGYSSYNSGTGLSIHTPIFKYRYNGQHFLVQSAKPCSCKLLDKEMVRGKEYIIYVDPKTPSVFILEKRIGVILVLQLLFGISCICIGLYGLML